MPFIILRFKAPVSKYKERCSADRGQKSSINATLGQKQFSSDEANLKAAEASLCGCDINRPGGLSLRYYLT